jgi:hypothetical protein
MEPMVREATIPGPPPGDPRKELPAQRAVDRLTQSPANQVPGARAIDRLRSTTSVDLPCGRAIRRGWVT